MKNINPFLKQLLVAPQILVKMKEIPPAYKNKDFLQYCIFYEQRYCIHKRKSKLKSSWSCKNCVNLLIKSVFYISHLLFHKKKAIKKCFIFHIKSSFCVQDILVLVFLLFLFQPLLIPNGNCKLE